MVVVVYTADTTTTDDATIKTSAGIAEIIDITTLCY